MSLMMSSCWTLRLKRRNAPSMDSPSCTLTSATPAATPFRRLPSAREPAPTTIRGAGGNTACYATAGREPAIVGPKAFRRQTGAYRRGSCLRSE